MFIDFRERGRKKKERNMDERETHTPTGDRTYNLAMCPDL